MKQLTIAELHAAFDEWNDAIERAKREYAAHPIAACYIPGCPELCDKDDYQICKGHRKDRTVATARMRQHRAQTGTP